METKSVDLPLLAVLNGLIAELPDPAYQYMVMANYYDHLTAGREGQRVYIATIWLSAESSDEVSLTEEGLVCQVRLSQHNLSVVSRIVLPYEQIWSIQRLDDSPADQQSLYYRSDKLKLPRPVGSK